MNVLTLSGELLDIVYTLVSNHHIVHSKYNAIICQLYLNKAGGKW